MVQLFSGNVEGLDSEPIAVRTLSDGKWNINGAAIQWKCRGTRF